MIISTDVVLFSLFFSGILFWRILCMKKELKKENAVSLNQTWKLKIAPVLKQAWQERNLIMIEFKKTIKKPKA